MINDQNFTNAADKLIETGVLGSVLVVTIIVSAIIIWWLAKQWLKALDAKDAEAKAHRETSERMATIAEAYRGDAERRDDFIRGQFDVLKELVKQRDRA